MSKILLITFRCYDGEIGNAPELCRGCSLKRFPEIGMLRLWRKHEGDVPPDQHVGREGRQGLLRRLHPGEE